MSKTQMIAPGGVIGIIGGGQLGRMMSMAAAQLGYHVHIYTPEKNAPASEVSAVTHCAPYEDKEALRTFADAVDVVTFEFENIPHESLHLLEENKPVSPSASVLKLSQNRLREKDFIQGLGVGTAPYRPVTSEAMLEEATQALGFPCILKTSEMGYDGKGQKTLRTAEDVAPAWKALGAQECVLEGFVEFALEISVIVARNSLGETALYPPVHNVHQNHILHQTIAPAGLSGQIKQKALKIAQTLAEKTELVGLLAVEMFVTKTHEVLVNEVAPRPHNSGHWSMEGAVTSQFEQAIRAICGLPLGSTNTIAPRCEMTNLIGEDGAQWHHYLQQPGTYLHLYGKKHAREGRKMGHVTRLLNN